MKRRFTAERRNQLAQTIITEGHVSVSEASEKFEVSTETIRKDLIYLEKEGIIKKSRGGAMPSAESLEKPLIQKKTEHADIKNKIALKALDFIPCNGHILLDSGTTVLALARLLTLKSGLTVFTNSAAAFNLLADSQNKVFILGGMVRPSSLAVVGSWANEQLSSINVDVAFIGSDGFKNFSGPATASYEESEIKKNMLKASSHNIVLADSSKFDTTTPFQFGTWDQIETLITDDGVNKKYYEDISNSTNILLV